MSSSSMLPRKQCGQCNKLISTSNFSRHMLLHRANPPQNNRPVTDDYIPVVKVHRNFFDSGKKAVVVSQATQTDYFPSHDVLFDIIGTSLGHTVAQLASDWCLCCNNQSNIHTCLLSSETVHMYKETAVFMFTSDYNLRHFLLSNPELHTVVLSNGINIQQTQNPTLYCIQNATDTNDISAVQ